MKFSKYHLTTDELSEYDFKNKRILFSTRSGSSLLVEDEIYQLALKNEFANIPSEILDVLIAKEFIVQNDQDEYAFIMSNNKEKRAETNFLSMTIQPTANCQLGCHYCGQTHSKDYAKDDVINKYVERIESIFYQKSIYNGLSVTWYGGEPLMGYSSIVKSSRKFIEICKEKNFTYLASIVTNGLNLKPNLFETLVNECNITDYQITLDGTANSHDKRRITKKGEATFDIIMKNIIDVTNTETYTSKNCQITIRVNIDQTNCNEVDDLIELINEKKLNKKLAIYFAPITDFGGNDASKESLSMDFFAEKEIEWMFKCYELGISINQILPTRKSSVCMVQKEDSEVWDAYGNIYTCWEFPYTSYAGDEHKVGNLFQPESTYNKNATLRNWDETIDSGKTWCKTCSHLPVCGGGCPKLWEEGTPACPTFKSNFKEKLLLDYFIRKMAKTSEKN